MPCDFKTRQVLTTDHGALWEYTSLEESAMQNYRAIFYSLRELRLIDIRDDKVKL